MISQKKILERDINNIVYLKADSNYTYFHFNCGNKTITSYTLKHWQALLSNTLFIRIHKSYLINKSMIKSINRKNHTISLSNGDDIPISRGQRKEFMKST